jgi:hypothetical protein
LLESTTDWILSDFAMMAEIIGMFAIVFALIFIGLQIAASNREPRAATLQSAMNSEISMSAVFADHAGTSDKVITGAPLAEGEESRRAILVYNLLMTESESRHHQMNVGYLDHSVWKARQSMLPQLASLPILAWRESLGGISHAPDFLALLDEMISARPS